MTIGLSASKAVASAVKGLIATVEISDSSGRVLATLPYPKLSASATETGIADQWRVADAKGGLISSGKIGIGLTLDRTDLQWGSVVTIDKIEIEVR